MRDLVYTPVSPSECGNYWVCQDGKRHRPLLPKHKKFCRLYVEGMSAAAAARKSGFTKLDFFFKAETTSRSQC